MDSYGIAKMDGFNHKKLGFSTSQLEILKNTGDSATHLSNWGAPKKAARSCHIIHCHEMATSTTGFMVP
jgi:hypothetical protein